MTLYPHNIQKDISDRPFQANRNNSIDFNSHRSSISKTAKIEFSDFGEFIKAKYEINKITPPMSSTRSPSISTLVQMKA